jgi:hypothetical protein
MPKTLVSPVIRKILRMRRVEELDLLHVHHELVMPVVHQFNKQFTQPGGGVDVDLALNVDDLDAIPGVVVKLQIHKSSSPYSLA